MNARVLITASGWITAGGLLVMFLTAHGRYNDLRGQVERLKQSQEVLAFESRARVRDQAAEQQLRQARPAMPVVRPMASVQVREAAIQSRLRVAREAAERIAAERIASQQAGVAEDAASMVPLGAGEVVGQDESSNDAAVPVEAAAAVADKEAARKNSAFFSNLDRMIADLDRTIEDGRKEQTQAGDGHVSTAVATGKKRDEPVGAVASKNEQGAPQAVRAAQPDVQVIYVHPFGKRTSGTWVKYHRYEKSGGNVKFYFSDREVFTAPDKSVEWEQRVLVN